MRDKSVSIAKAIAIILMVLAHARFNQFGETYINMFHMPLFFFFSGYCFKHRICVIDYCKKRITGIYIPFVKYSLIFLSLHNIFYHLNLYNNFYGFRGEVSHLYTLKDYSIRVLHILTRMTDNEQLLGGYWFLNTLFFCSFIALALILIDRKFQIGGVKMLIISLLITFFSIPVPYFNIGMREMLATSFFLFGYYYKQTNWKVENSSILIPVCAIIVLIGAIVFPTNMLNLTRINVLPYTLFALSGTLMVFSFSKLISSSNSNVVKSLDYIGNNTLIILTWHFLCFKLISLLIIKVKGLPIEQLAEFPVIEHFARSGWWILYTIIGVALPICLSKFDIFIRNNYKSIQ